MVSAARASRVWPDGLPARADRILNWPDHLSNSGQPLTPPPTDFLVPLQIVEPQRLYRQIAEQLRALIAKGEFAVGARLPAERDLAKQLGVSRPSVREALIALEVEGWVEVRTGSGVYVLDRSQRAAAPRPPVRSSRVGAAGADPRAPRGRGRDRRAGRPAGASARTWRR